ncbi:hypothetical protein FACS189430_06170 [Bacteroidia bacterium]|nr:hypothetical protein FACS189430_06170 [Bacteroidia bacterium]
MIQLKNNKYVFIILFTLYSIFKIGTLNKNGLMRYDNILFGIKSFEERKVFFDKNAEKILAH